MPTPPTPTSPLRVDCDEALAILETVANYIEGAYSKQGRSAYVDALATCRVVLPAHAALTAERDTYYAAMRQADAAKVEVARGLLKALAQRAALVDALRDLLDGMEDAPPNCGATGYWYVPQRLRAVARAALTAAGAGA